MTGIRSLRASYRSGSTTPSRLAAEFSAERDASVWISTFSKEQLAGRARWLEEHASPETHPLWGIPFAVKDNIDVAGLPTTSGCPAFAYLPERNAAVVERLVRAGAMAVGKTNMDQFATGLVGVRSPYGACLNPFNARYIAGGSSSGSAAAVALGHVCFSLGTDTAGSGRVPAAFCNLVGLKPTRGLVSGSGVVPACRTLDCVSIFAVDCGEAAEVLACAAEYDASDPFSRRAPSNAGGGTGQARFGVPRADQLEFFGDSEARRLYERAVSAAPGPVIEIDYGPFREAAGLLYSGPWLAERLAALETFANLHAAAMDSTVRGIIEGASKFTAVDTFRAFYRLAELRRAAEREMSRVDALLLPTAGTIYRIAEVLADPVRLNSNLGYYTNFVNLLDLSAVAVPAGFRGDGLPFGISLIGPAFSEGMLLAQGAELHRALGGRPAGIKLAVAGAHLSGQPLNHQLTTRGARLAQKTRTSSAYRLFALQGTVPPKPGLVRHEDGAPIDVEVWELSPAAFGEFVAEVPPPMAIGTVELESGEKVKGFLCEPFALRGAADITSWGGWRAWLASQPKEEVLSA